MARFTLQEYEKADFIQLPYKSKIRLKSSGNFFVLTNFKGFCGSCGAKITNEIKGTIQEYNHCLDLRYGGVCSECKVIVPFHYRIYPNDNRVLSNEPGGWMEGPFMTPPKKKKPIVIECLTKLASKLLGGKQMR